MAPIGLNLEGVFSTKYSGLSIFWRAQTSLCSIMGANNLPLYSESFFMRPLQEPQPETSSQLESWTRKDIQSPSFSSSQSSGLPLDPHDRPEDSSPAHHLASRIVDQRYSKVHETSSSHLLCQRFTCLELSRATTGPTAKLVHAKRRTSLKASLFSDALNTAFRSLSTMTLLLLLLLLKERSPVRQLSLLCR